MAQLPVAASQLEFSAQYAQLLESCYAKATAARWNLSRESFAQALRRSAEKRFRDAPASPGDLEAYLNSLYLKDLALACACSEGIETAWEFFVAHFRADLRNAARAILRSSGPGNDARAEELADSVFADLYGIRGTRDGLRKSLLESFHGRSKLSTWLRAVLAQRYVDLLRAAETTVSLDTSFGPDAEGPPLELARSTEAAPHDPHRARYLALIERALSLALAGLAPRERMLLACYYVDELTLAQIGRMMGEHESTVSRQLERTRRGLREAVTGILRRGIPAQEGHAALAGLDESQVEVAFEYAVEDWAFDLSRALFNAGAADPSAK